MKLRNKKTGEIGEIEISPYQEGYADEALIFDEYGNVLDRLHSIAEVYKVWEDISKEEYERLKKFEPFIDGKQILLEYPTEEEAEKAVEKLKAWKRLKDKGFRFKRYQYGDILEGTIVIEAQFNNDGQAEQDLAFLFGGEE